MQELKPWFGEPPHAQPPDLPGYRQLAHERVSIGRLSVLGAMLIPLWIFAIIFTISLLGGRSEYSVEFTPGPFLLFVLVFVTVILVHEIVHGVAAAILGSRPSFGVGPGFAYTTFLDPMPRWRYLIVGLAPLVLMTAAAIAGALVWPSLAGWLIAAAAINASGAIGDLWMSYRILRAPRGSMFYDLADGFAVFIPESSPLEEAV